MMVSCPFHQKIKDMEFIYILGHPQPKNDGSSKTNAGYYAEFKSVKKLQKTYYKK